eukprot:scaffold78647_cov63-Phaeocystis_antarctica.AAC.1
MPFCRSTRTKRSRRWSRIRTEACSSASCSVSPPRPLALARLHLQRVFQVVQAGLERPTRRPRRTKGGRLVVGRVVSLGADCHVVSSGTPSCYSRAESGKLPAGSRTLRVLRRAGIGPRAAGQRALRVVEVAAQVALQSGSSPPSGSLAVVLAGLLGPSAIVLVLACPLAAAGPSAVVLASGVLAAVLAAVPKTWRRRPHGYSKAWAMAER